MISSAQFFANCIIHLPVSDGNRLSGTFAIKVRRLITEVNKEFESLVNEYFGNIELFELYIDKTRLNCH